MMKLIASKYFAHKNRIMNFVWRSFQIFSRHGFNFVNFIVFTTILSPYDFGIYSYIISSILFLALFADFGISGAVSKYVAEYNAVDKDKIKYIFWNAGIIIGVVSILISAGFLLFGKYFFGDSFSYLIYVLPVIFFAPMVGLYSGISMGLQKFKYLSVVSVSVGAASVITNYFLIINFGLVGALINQTLFYGALFIALFFGYRDWVAKINKALMKPIVRYSLIIGFTSLSYYLYGRADIIILGQFGYIEEIAYYSVLTKVFELSIIPFAILGQVSGPIIAGIYAKKMYHQVRKDFEKMVALLAIGGVLMSIVLYFMVPFFIETFFADYFTDATRQMFSLLIFILPIRVIAAYVGAAHTTATGNAHFSLWPMIIAGAANVILDILFISLFGFIGVVYSTLICYTFAITVFIFRYYAKLRRLTSGTESV